MLNSSSSAGNATLTMVAARIVATVPTIAAATTRARRWSEAGRTLDRRELAGRGKRPHAERERGVGELVPHIAAADALGQRIEPREADEQRPERRGIDAPRRPLQCTLTPAPHARRTHRRSDRRSGGGRGEHRGERMQIFAELPEQKRHA